MRRPWLIDRRTVLRGAGAALALPLLDAMRPLGAADPAAARGRPPVRLAVLFFPNGVWPKAWFPTAAGADFELPFSLAPLAVHRERLLVFSGLDKKHSHGGDGHYAKTANFLTGLLVTKTVGRDISVGGPSLDQVAAERLGHLTPLPSLELGCDRVISGIDSNVNYTRLYGSYISWRTAKEPVAREINPRFVYDRLFGAKDAAGKPLARAAADDRSLLDLALSDARDLRGRLGRDDQGKVDEYLEAVRAVERRIAFASQPDPRDWKPDSAPDAIAAPAAGTPANYREHVRQMFDLMALALWTDSTRLITFMMGNDVSGRNFTNLADGVKGAHHQLSHHENDPAKIAQYQRINRWFVTEYAYLLDQLAAIREGDGTLLDHSLVVCGSSLCDGNKHEPSNLPILLAGGGGGRVLSGRHLAYPKGTPLCQLWLGLLRRVGVPAESFGDATAELPGLSEPLVAPVAAPAPAAAPSPAPVAPPPAAPAATPALGAALKP